MSSSKAARKIKEWTDVDAEDVVDQAKDMGKSVAEGGADLFKEAGKWISKNNQNPLLGIAALTLGVGLMTWALTKGRRFIIIV